MTHKRRPDGLIPLHFRYRDAYGTSRPKVVYGRTEKEAQAKKAAFLRDVDAAIRMDQAGRTVASWADEWLEVYKRPSVSPRTFETYAHDIALIKVGIGNKPLRAVTETDVKRLLNARKGLSASAIRKTHMTVKALFQAAVENRMIGYSPCVGVKPPPGPAGTHRALSKEEVSAILQTALNHRFGAVAALMLLGGLRRGEACAFNFDTDVQDGQLVVARAVIWPANQPVETSPKSRAGIRRVPIFPPMQPFIGKGLALPGRSGYTSETGFNRAYQSFVQECGVNFRCHDLRHTFATMLFDAGTDVKTAQLWLGHDDPSVTMKIYTHLSKERKAASTKDAETWFKDQVVVKLVTVTDDTPKNPNALP